MGDQPLDVMNYAKLIFFRYLISPCRPDWLCIDQIGFKLTILPQPIAAEITDLRPHFQLYLLMHTVQLRMLKKMFFIVVVSFVHFACRMSDLFRS